jgi:hypothetical protein
MADTSPPCHMSQCLHLPRRTHISFTSFPLALFVCSSLVLLCISSAYSTTSFFALHFTVMSPSLPTRVSLDDINSHFSLAGTENHPCDWSHPEHIWVLGNVGRSKGVPSRRWYGPLSSLSSLTTVSQSRYIWLNVCEYVRSCIRDVALGVGVPYLM